MEPPPLSAPLRHARRRGRAAGTGKSGRADTRGAARRRRGAAAAKAQAMDLADDGVAGDAAELLGDL